jgi:hypothetical protein
MTKIAPDNIRSLRHIRLERERLRYMLLRTELEFIKRSGDARKLFTFPNLIRQFQQTIFTFLRKKVSKWF